MGDTKRIVLSVTGSDRPGLTSALAEAVAGVGGNWQEGHLSQLGGLYVGSVLVELDADKQTNLEDAVHAIDKQGLAVSIHHAQADIPQQGAPLLFELVGQDRPGIIREVTAILAKLGANIESLSSGEQTGAWAGEHLFHAEVTATLPEGTSPDVAQAALEEISSEIMVDFSFASASN
ncbi:MAG: ACT domain-containing protein [Erythrobacter sp.]